MVLKRVGFHCESQLHWNQLVVRANYIETSWLWEPITLKPADWESQLHWNQVIVRAHYIETSWLWPGGLYSRLVLLLNGLNGRTCNSSNIFQAEMFIFLIVFVYRVMELLEGKGGYSKGRYQGKANKLQNRNKAAQLIKDHVASNTSESWWYIYIVDIVLELPLQSLCDVCVLLMCEG